METQLAKEVAEAVPAGTEVTLAAESITTSQAMDQVSTASR